MTVSINPAPDAASNDPKGKKLPRTLGVTLTSGEVPFSFVLDPSIEERVLLAMGALTAERTRRWLSRADIAAKVDTLHPYELTDVDVPGKKRVLPCLVKCTAALRKTGALRKDCLVRPSTVGNFRLTAKGFQAIKTFNDGCERQEREAFEAHRDAPRLQDWEIRELNLMVLEPALLAALEGGTADRANALKFFRANAGTHQASVQRTLRLVEKACHRGTQLRYGIPQTLMMRIDDVVRRLARTALNQPQKA